jgi:hypothetical protein
MMKSASENSVVRAEEERYIDDIGGAGKKRKITLVGWLIGLHVPIILAVVPTVGREEGRDDGY